MASYYWDKMMAARVNRRRVLQSAGVAGAAAGAVWLVGCGGGAKTEKTPSIGGTKAAGSPTANKAGYDVANEQNPPRAGGRFQEVATVSFDTFDPHVGIAYSTAYFPKLYNVLVNQSALRPEFIVHDLAISYENPDSITWVFKIRPGVKIAPNELGVPERDMTAEDVVATFERIKTEPRAGNGSFVKQYVDKVTATGDVVTIRTKQPYAWFLNRVGIFINTIPPSELLASDTMIGKMRTKSAGGGPYVLVSSIEGEGAKMNRNPNYYGKDENNGDAQLPYIDGIGTRAKAMNSSTAFRAS